MSLPLQIGLLARLDHAATEGLGEQEPVPLLFGDAGTFTTIFEDEFFFKVGGRAGAPSLILVGGPGFAADLVVVCRPALNRTLSPDRSTQIKTGSNRRQDRSKRHYGRGVVVMMSMTDEERGQVTTTTTTRQRQVRGVDKERRGEERTHGQFVNSSRVQEVCG